jgi:hypothetical protein
MYNVFTDYTFEYRLISLAKHFGGIKKITSTREFAIPQNRVAAFNAAAFAEGLYLKHKSPTGVYHYSSRGLQTL